jgi:hypothetical protein
LDFVQHLRIAELLQTALPRRRPLVAPSPLLIATSGSSRAKPTRLLRRERSLRMAGAADMEVIDLGEG